MKSKSIPTKAGSGHTLGIEGGGTKTTWALLDSSDRVLKQGSAGPGNTLLLSDGRLAALFRSIRAKTGAAVEAIGGGFAGCSSERERQRVRKHVRTFWPQARKIVVTGDAESALAGAFGDADGICVIAGTGSNVVARYKGKIYKAGGWGHLFSDHGSGYDLARRGLEAAYQHYDATQKVSALGEIFLRATTQNSLEDLMRWMLRHSGKTDVAALAPCVFEAAGKGDPRARELIRQGAGALAEHVGFLARRLKLKKPSVCLVGSLFEKEPVYRNAFKQALGKILRGSRVFLRRGGMGGILAATLVNCRPVFARIEAGTSELGPASVGQSTTEQRNPRSRGLDKKSVPQLVDLFINEEKYVQRALSRQRKPLARACELVANRLKRGGRLFYVGAGTSGRLGVVDASEMPPTFNAPPEQVQAIIAGGGEAVFQSQEGAEDDGEAGAQAVVERGARRGDVVCGIAASGQTPFVMGALARARKIGAATILLSCNPSRPRVNFADVAIDLPTGPEIITGSTRLKAGTATKLALNMLSTIAMIRLGRVRDNFMIDVLATNGKLRQRAVRLVTDLTGCDPEQARQLLAENGWNVRRVVEKLEN